MRGSEAWAFVSEWIGANKRKICGYVAKRHLLRYSAYEMQDFLSEAYLVAYDTLMNCGNVPFDAYFWISFQKQMQNFGE